MISLSVKMGDFNPFIIAGNTEAVQEKCGQNTNPPGSHSSTFCTKHERERNKTKNLPQNSNNLDMELLIKKKSSQREDVHIKHVFHLHSHNRIILILTTTLHPVHTRNCENYYRK